MAISMYSITLTLFAVLPNVLGISRCTRNSASLLSNVTNAFENAQIVPDVLTSFNPSAILNVTFPETAVLPGELIPLPETSTEPQFSLCSNDVALAKQTFVLAMIDPDARTNVSVAQGRHFLGGGFVFSDNHSNKLVNTTPALSDYIGPEPLAGQSPHRYAIVAYIQPPNFDKIAPRFVNESTSRLFFNLSSFAAEVRLGNPIAGNFFYAANTTVATSSPGGAETSSNTSPFSTTTTIVSPTTSSTTTANSTTSSPGGAVTSSNTSPFSTTTTIVSPTTSSTTTSSTTTANSAQLARSNWLLTIPLLLVMRAFV